MKMYIKRLFEDDFIGVLQNINNLKKIIIVHSILNYIIIEGYESYKIVSLRSINTITLNLFLNTFLFVFGKHIYLENNKMWYGH